MIEMFTIPSFLGFLLPLAAVRNADEETRRRRAIRALRLSPHLLNDVGMSDYQSPADDPRWSRRFDLER